MRSAALPLLLLAALACAPASADFQDRGMVTGTVRTDLPPGSGTGDNLLTLWYRNPVPDGCAFSVLDPLNGIFGCPGLRWIRNKAGGEPGWQGLQIHPTCGSSNTAAGPAGWGLGDSWLGCLTWPSSPYFSLNNPDTQYWVVVANSDPAFDQCNDGPPGLSHAIRDPITDPRPSLYKVAMEQLPSGARRAHLIVNASNHPFRCDRAGYKHGPHSVFPFLSLGAQRDHGQGGAVTTMNRAVPPARRPHVRWTAWTLDYLPFGCDPSKGSELCFARGVHAGFYGLASWEGVKRMLFINTISEADLDYDTQAPAKTHWNWPVYDSFYYPGAEVAMISSVQLARMCGIDVPRQPLEPRPVAYSVDVTGIFGCASDLGLFSSRMPDSADVELEGFHWYLESVGTSGALWLSIEKPRVD